MKREGLIKFLHSKGLTKFKQLGVFDNKGVFHPIVGLFDEYLSTLPDEKEEIICSAIWFNDEIKRPHQPKNIDTGLVVCGRRHHNCFITVDALNKSIINTCREINNKAIQGFLTNRDRFVDRKEAGQIAFKANQITKETDCLMSEELY